MKKIESKKDNRPAQGQGKKEPELKETTTIRGSRERDSQFSSNKKRSSNRKKTSGNHPDPASSGKRGSKSKKKKRRGGKFIFSLLIIIGVSIWVFWLGWVQLDLPENTYGIIHTKTRGYRPVPVAPEGITWMWEKVIPTNMTIHLFEIRTETASINETGKLPMADLYKTVIDEDVDFTYRFNAKITYKINPQSLTGLIESGKISKEENGRWKNGIENDINTAMRDFLNGKITESAISADKAPSSDNTTSVKTLEKELQQLVESSVPEIIIENVEITGFELPEQDLYFTARDIYRERLKARETVRDQLFQAAIADNENFDQTIVRLEKMGMILDKYPVLLEYFKINPGNGINDFKPTGR